ncbi:aspartate--ammonia ligase [Bombilactobacillus thymidiniphilus]|uniref:Aspartate--ammonia ligase n=1 Tax=Bombilactobacillus thymidiniphilus TaxID=2923363 RepID=A0ABY4PBL6_9LACO|nr:aspartate--ammonia ligase [Bombilactobacillus thymidiniphilus]UQS83072.1 aspartate--ammonia ligase [Bombilactobacillus thymidiniphilus]
MTLILPEHYQAKLSLRQTQMAVQEIRTTFAKKFSSSLNLQQVTAPLFVQSKTGLNDNLNGVETPISFTAPALPGQKLEIVHSLAKWKRVALKKYSFAVHEGLYTDMKAIRKDEILDNFHSLYVDQWDWERVITRDARNLATLQYTVQQIFQAIQQVADYIRELYPQATPTLPEELYFITTQELLERYPNLTPKQREMEICRQWGAVFVMQIGATLSDGKKHDGRAPDYDDWQLNGDLLFWDELLQAVLEISSMGIRVDASALQKQITVAKVPERLQYPYHQAILHDELPLTIGGGIGQSRLCMLLLGKAHIGEVQASIWSQEMRQQCQTAQISLL